MTPDDAAFLLSTEQFRRFLFAAIQSAGIFTHHVPANGQSGRDLHFLEGRRSLGLDLLQMVHAGQPAAIREADANALATIDAAIREALNPPPKEKTRGRRHDRSDDPDGTDDRYDDLSE